MNICFFNGAVDIVKPVVLVLARQTVDQIDDNGSLVDCAHMGDAVKSRDDLFAGQSAPDAATDFGIEGLNSEGKRLAPPSSAALILSSSKPNRRPSTVSSQSLPRGSSECMERSSELRSAASRSVGVPHPDRRLEVDSPPV